MRKSINSISIKSTGIRKISQASKLIVKGETLGTLCAHSFRALAGCAARLAAALLSDRWQMWTNTHFGMPMMQPVHSYAANRQERGVRVVGTRSVG
jgi:hypothetical protein